MTRFTWLFFAVYLLLYAAVLLVDSFSAAVQRFVHKVADAFDPRPE